MNVYHYDLVPTASINSELQERIPQELMLEKAEGKIRSLTDVLSRTQALLLVERNNSQKMALHIDFLLEQHKADVKRLDLLLALDGKPARNTNPELSLLRGQVHKLENCLKEQAANLLEERTLLKSEWEKERQTTNKLNRELKSKVLHFQEQVIRSNQNLAQYHNNGIKEFIAGNYLEFEVENEMPEESGERTANLNPKNSHCLQQETKRLKRNCDDLKKEIISYQKKHVSQTTVVRDLKEEMLKTRERHQVQIKTLKEQMEVFRKQTEQLNKRRLNEGAGFRSEISLLRDELQRTQKQLCFLTLRKLELD